MLPLTPTRLGRYEIVEEIGKGAMGVVYLARDPLIGRLVALKTFRIGYSVKDQELEQFRVRFMREAQSAGILTHPNIVTIHDVVEESEEGLAFIAMEYVRGTNLKLMLQGEQPLSLPFVLDIIAQVGDALDYAHANGVVHRDVKPANILITADNKVKITDFGIARLDSSNLTQEGQLLGTPNYMAPEQIQGKDIDYRADLFSLGVVLYEMLARHKPFQGENLTVVSHRIVYDHFTPLREFVRALPPGLEQILSRALEKDPGRRYQRSREMVGDLRRVVESNPARDDLNETQSLSATVVLPPSVVPPPAKDRWSLFSRWRQRSAPPPPPPLPFAVAAAPSNFGAAPPAAMPPPPDLADTAATAAPIPPPQRRASVGRLLAALAWVAATAILAGAAFRLWQGWSQPAPVAPTAAAEQQRQARLVELIDQGSAAMRRGDFTGAVARFRQAELLEPSRDETRQLREAAEQQARGFRNRLVRDQSINANLGKAKDSLAARKYELAVFHASAVLAMDPRNEEATAIQKQAQEEQARQARQRAAPAAALPPGPAEETTVHSTPIEAQPAPSEVAAAEAQAATLRIHFRSELPEGVLIVWLGGREIVRERFGPRGGLFRSRKQEPFEFTSRPIDVPAGSIGLRIQVAPRGIPAVVRDREAGFPGGTSHTLEIHLNQSADVSIALN